MSLMFSTKDAEGIADALRTLLSPLDFPTLDAWQAAVSESVQRVTGAERVGFILPIERAACAGVYYTSGASDLIDAGNEYGSYYYALDRGLHRASRQRLEIWTRSMVWPRAELERSEYYNDFCVRHRSRDSIGMSVSVGTLLPAPASLVLHAERSDAFGTGGREMALFRLLLPALKSGLSLGLQLAGRVHDLGAVLDHTEEGLVLFDARGRTLHANAALLRLLEVEPERERLCREMERLARSVPGVSTAKGRRSRAGPVDSPFRCMTRTGTADYYLRVGQVGRNLLGTDGVVLVAVTRNSAEVVPDSLAGERFGLTRAEAQVARLLADGRTNNEVAAALFISPHTARHHTEKVLAKLGVHSRRAVKQVLLVGS